MGGQPPAPGGSRPEEVERAAADQPLGFRVGRAARSLKRSWAERLSPLHVSPPQAALLRSLLAHDRSGIRGLARLLDTDPMNVKHLADQLEEAGLISSEVDPADRRRRSLTLTPRGRQLAAEVEVLVQEQERWLAARLGEEGMAGLSEALSELEAVLNTTDHGPAAWDERHRHRPFSADPDPLVLEVASGLPAGRALDLGAGTGRNSLGLAELGWSVTAVDFSEVALEQLRDSARERGVKVEAVRFDLLRYRPPQGAFQLCLLANIHLPEEQLGMVLEMAASSLAPGGHLLVVGHHAKTPGGHGPRHQGLLFTEELLSRLLPPELRMVRLERHLRSHGGDRRGTEDLALLLLAQRQ
jgi:DNA-binding MarR family transcriptional regulator/SAM-dependent methyltransferase